MPDEVVLAIQNGYTPYYCFRIILNTKQTLHLTSAKQDLQKNGIVFKSVDLNIISGKFDDDYNNSLVLESVDYPLNQDKFNFQDAVFAIDVHWENYSYFFGNYICTKCEKLEFRLQLNLESEMFKYHNFALDYYSKTCRAKLGDTLCGVDIKKFGTIHKLLYIDGRKIKLFDKILSKSFVKGLCLIDNVGERWSAKIVYHTEIEIKLDQVIPTHLQDTKECYLIPCCDKTIETCNTVFNNCVNFRGEPFC